MDETVYGWIVYNTLITGLNSSPDYMLEKAPAITEGVEAFWRLDPNNQKRAMEYCIKWGIPIPDVWTEYAARTIQAVIKLGEMGIELN